MQADGLHCLHLPETAGEVQDFAGVDFFSGILETSRSTSPHSRMDCASPGCGRSVSRINHSTRSRRSLIFESAEGKDQPSFQQAGIWAIPCCPARRAGPVAVRLAGNQFRVADGEAVHPEKIFAVNTLQGGDMLEVGVRCRADNG